MGLKAFVLVWLVSLPAGWAAAYALGGHLRRKGYNSPLAALILVVMFCSLWILSVLLASRGDDLNRSLHPLRAPFAVIWLPWVALGLAAAVIRILPEQPRRVPGPRVAEFPYGTVGAVLTANAFIIPVVACIAGMGLKEAVQIFLLLFAAGATASSVAARVKSTARRATDTRPPVLYLRPFNREEEAFAEILWHPNKYYPEPEDGVGDERFPTFEEYFSTEVRNALGPLTALGNPEDFAPPGAAAYRAYISDGEWRREFRDLAFRARCLLAIAEFRGEPSGNVLWEFEHLRKSGLEHKVFLLTRPRPVPEAHRFRQKVAWMLQFAVTHRWSPRRIRRPRPAQWRNFVELMSSIGYSVQQEDPGPGAVLSFDREVRSVLLLSGASTASGYVQAIRMSLTRSAATEGVAEEEAT